jgi:anti-sigma B factor antagonist
MFDIHVGEGGRIRLSGRLDAAEADNALAILAELDAPMTLDCSELEYISSAGIGVIMETYKRLLKGGHRLTLVQMTPRVRNVFRYAGLDRVLQIE